ncbi:ribonuclease 3-like protein 3 [Bidens hawaiensis]|uniref:ribonuclease 3-like protein 3 n=1 Tax=Bidens hawaiensis TaxID=980011 RepID=UPI0040491A36
MQESIAAVESILRYRFNNKRLLEEALTHPSCTDGFSYQRLEFLGDSVLALAVSEFFFLLYREVDAGVLSRIRAANISNEKLARVAVHHGLHKYIRHNKATVLNDKVWDFLVQVEEEDMVVYGGHIKAPKVLADIVESVAAAVFVDLGFDLPNMWQILRCILEPLVMFDVILAEPQPITALYEACQKDGKQVDIQYSRKGESLCLYLISYIKLSLMILNFTLFKLVGDKTVANVYVDGTFFATGSSETKENAKLHAAEVALSKMTKSKICDTGLQTIVNINESIETEAAKQKVNELCRSKHSSDNISRISNKTKIVRKPIEKIVHMYGADLCLQPIESVGQPVTDMQESIAAVESIMRYRFNNKRLLEEALTHSSCKDGLSYQRLEFLGDAVLALAVSKFFFLSYSEMDAGVLSRLRAANISNEKLARVAVHHGFHKYIHHNKATVLNDKVCDFLVEVEEEDMVVYGGHIKAPKVLADIVESVAAAVFIDLGFDLPNMWQILKPILEPLVMLDVILAEPQPITALYKACQKDGKQVDIQYSIKGDKTVANVYVDGTFFATGSSGTKENAKLHAAEAALSKMSKPKSGDTSLQTIVNFNESMETEAAKQKLYQLCSKKKWSTPTYKVEQELGPSHDKRFVASVAINLSDAGLTVNGKERSRRKDAENSAASAMLCALQKLGYA